MLPLSEKFSARLPVFTDFPSDKIVLAKADSNLLRDVSTLSTAIQKDSFCMALIDQVVITSQRTFEFVPKIGNSIIVFGDASDADEKFNRLKLFYKKVIPKTGWNYYSVVNVQYKNQVVAKRKGADDKSADSLRTIQIMQQIAINSEKAANDSVQMVQSDNGSNTTDENIIQQSMQRDDNEDAPGTFEKVLQEQQTKVITPVVIKPTEVSKPVVPVSKPKPAIVSDKKPADKKSKDTKDTKPKAATPKPVSDKPKPRTNASAAQTTKPTTVKPVPKKKTVESDSNNDY